MMDVFTKRYLSVYRWLPAQNDTSMYMFSHLALFLVLFVMLNSASCILLSFPFQLDTYVTSKLTLVRPQVFDSINDWCPDINVICCYRNKSIIWRFHVDMVSINAIVAKYWWYNDYEKIPQFNGCWFLYGWCCCYGTTILLFINDVSCLWLCCLYSGMYTCRLWLFIVYQNSQIFILTSFLINLSCCVLFGLCQKIHTIPFGKDTLDMVKIK